MVAHIVLESALMVFGITIARIISSANCLKRQKEKIKGGN